MLYPIWGIYLTACSRFMIRDTTPGDSLRSTRSRQAGEENPSNSSRAPKKLARKLLMHKIALITLWQMWLQLATQINLCSSRQFRGQSGPPEADPMTSPLDAAMRFSPGTLVVFVLNWMPCFTRFLPSEHGAKWCEWNPLHGRGRISWL